jgi:hypothetical protein
VPKSSFSYFGKYFAKIIDHTIIVLSDKAAVKLTRSLNISEIALTGGRPMITGGQNFLVLGTLPGDTNSQGVIAH